MKRRSEPWYLRDRRLGLRLFALAITLLNVVGYTYLGFEPAPLAPLVGMLSAYATEFVLESVGAWADRRRASYRGGVTSLVNFLLPAHITGMAVSMLLYSTERLWPIAFAAALGIASKSIFRVLVQGRPRHWLNPSNFGIALTLILFPWIGITQPYMFTEGLDSVGDWVFPALVIVLGTSLNARFTHRLPLIAAWLGGFVLQGWMRHLIFDTRFAATLMPMTGLAFLLFTFYMVTDPPTTPARPRNQVVFGLAVALTYGGLMISHIVFGLFFALVLTSCVRGVYLYLRQIEGRAECELDAGALTEVVLEPRMQSSAARRSKSTSAFEKERV